LSLKNEWSLTPLRVRGLERVALHADLTILAKLATTVARTRAVPLAAWLDERHHYLGSVDGGKNTPRADS